MPTLNWIGKDKVVSHHQDVPYRVLEHKYGFTAEKGEQGEPTNSGNKIIHGDNLEALKSLLPEYEGRIKCIYIDPPYNTGNENWVYNDNVNHPKIKKWLGEVVGKEGDDLTRHDKWLCMMYPRLKLLHKLMANDGVIFISIDDNEQANLKLLCDEIFSYSNCIGPIVQNKMNSKNDTVNIQKNHEFILVYRKKKKVLNGSKAEPTIVNQKEKTKKIYKEADKYFYLNDYITTRGEGGVLNARSNLGHTIYFHPHTKDIIAKCDYDIELAKTCNDSKKLYFDDEVLISKGYEPIRPPKVRGKLGCWTWSLDKVNKQKEELYITGKKGSYKVKKRTFVKKEEVIEEDGSLFILLSEPGNSRSIIDFSTNEGTKNLNDIMNAHEVFDNPKNVDMLEYLIKLVPGKDLTVLDSFAGSGTTAQAVLQLNKKDKGNRNFILIEMEEYAKTTTTKRIKRVSQGYKSQNVKKSTIRSFPISETTLKRADSIIKELSEAKKDKSLENIKVEAINNRLAITGEKTINGFVPGTGGAFDYYELGLPLFDKNQNLNEEVGLPKIREYIWFSETHTAFIEPNAEPYYLGQKDQSAYYFIYEKDQLTTLDYDALDLIKTKAEQYIIYADNCLLPKEFMAKNNIIFKKIPRDITRF